MSDVTIDGPDPVADQSKSLISRMAYWVRDRLNAELFSVISVDGRDVLDVGGGFFFMRLLRRGHRWNSYTVVEPGSLNPPQLTEQVRFVQGDAQKIPLSSESYDEVLAIQVLEHVFSPEAAVREMYRCLRPGGRLVILVPQSGNLHMVPHHYSNLTRFWLFEMAARLGAEIELWKPMGGAWRTIASRLFLMFWPVFGWHDTRDPLLARRSWGFWLTLPLQIIVAVIFFPLALALSLVDIREEANNHLMVIRKPAVS